MQTLPLRLGDGLEFADLSQFSLGIKEAGRRRLADFHRFPGDRRHLVEFLRADIPAAQAAVFWIFKNFILYN